MKAIETKYKGYRFRSRLEARWAVFFDALGIQWEYEPEGFDLGEAGWYLPDFLIFCDDNSEGVWFEVKGKKATKPDINKLEALCDHTGKHGFIASGTMGVPVLEEKRRGRVDLCGSKILHRAPRSLMEFCGNVERDFIDYCMDAEDNYLCGFYEDGNGNICIDHVYVLDTAPEHNIASLDVPLFIKNKSGNLIDIMEFLKKTKSENSGIWIVSKVQENMRITHGAFNTGSGRFYRTKSLSRAYEKARSARFEHGETP